jgi:hypothetical protein
VNYRRDGREADDGRNDNAPPDYQVPYLDYNALNRKRPEEYINGLMNTCTVGEEEAH